MRIASYNVENLFDRAKALNQRDRAAARPTLERHARINALFERPLYSEADKQEMVALLRALGLVKKDDAGKFALLRVIRGKLLKRPKTGGVEILARGRESWVGWVELKTEAVNELAMQHTAMVMRDLKADVLGVIEAENRVVLKEFSALLLKQVKGAPFAHVMVVDGNVTAASTSACSRALGTRSSRFARMSTTATRSGRSSAVTAPSTRSRRRLASA
jgi:hypothetical protein